MKARILELRARSHPLRWALGALVVIAVAAGVIYGRGETAPPQTTVLAKPSVAPKVTAAGGVSTAPASPVAQTPPLPAPKVGETLTAMFNRLSLSTSPEDKLAAFLVLKQCDTAVHWIDVPGVTSARPSTEGCEGLTLDGIHQAQALPLILSAAEAGVPDAFRQMMFVRGRYDTDPLFQASYERIVDINVAKGDEQAKRAKWAIDNERKIKPVVESILASNVVSGRKP